MPADVNTLSLAQCHQALLQLFASPRFREFNPHLSLPELRDLRQLPIVWPEKPVFSPYDTTHDHYSQVRFAGVKYLVHRISLRLLLERPLVDECSHILHLGIATGRSVVMFSICDSVLSFDRNVNPLHIVEESNIVNQSRKACAMFIEKWEWLWELGAVGHHSWSQHDGYVQMLLRLSGCCSFIHPRRCLAWDPRWEDRTFIDMFPASAAG